MIRRLLTNRDYWRNIAVIANGKEILCCHLAQEALSIQKYLPQGQTENIAIFLPNCSSFISALLGTLMLGMRAFPLNILLTRHELIPLLKQASVNIVITSKRFAALFENSDEENPAPMQVIYVEDLSSGETGDFPSVINVSPDEPMMLLSTSGTTGNSKIVQLSEKNIEASVLGYLNKLDFDKKNIENVRYILATPLFTAYGLMILFVCLMKSFPLILLQEGFTLDSFYKVAAEQRATHFEGGASVPLLMEQMAGRPIHHNLTLLKHFGFGGSKVSVNTLRALLNAYPGVWFWQGYGMTEASPLITKYANAKMEKLDSVGTAIAGMSISVDSDGVITDAPYTEGEVIVKGQNVMLGYYKNELETKKVLKNGYLYTGDIGYLDEDGYLYICGRKKNIIIVRGLNVHPEEVEACIINSLLVKDCIVYGETDALGNEMVCADIVPMNPDIQTEKIRAYFKAHLSEYKQPHKIQIVSAIRKVASGKTERVDKGKL